MQHFQVSKILVRNHMTDPADPTDPARRPTPHPCLRPGPDGGGPPWETTHAMDQCSFCLAYALGQSLVALGLVASARVESPATLVVTSRAHATHVVLTASLADDPPTPPTPEST